MVFYLRPTEAKKKIYDGRSNNLNIYKHTKKFVFMSGEIAFNRIKIPFWD